MRLIGLRVPILRVPFTQAGEGSYFFMGALGIYLLSVAAHFYNYQALREDENTVETVVHVMAKASAINSLGVAKGKRRVVIRNCTDAIAFIDDKYLRERVLVVDRSIAPGNTAECSFSYTGNNGKQFGHFSLKASY